MQSSADNSCKQLWDRHKGGKGQVVVVFHRNWHGGIPLLASLPTTALVFKGKLPIRHGVNLPFSSSRVSQSIFAMHENNAYAGSHL